MNREQDAVTDVIHADEYLRCFCPFCCGEVLAACVRRPRVQATQATRIMLILHALPTCEAYEKLPIDKFFEVVRARLQNPS